MRMKSLSCELSACMHTGTHEREVAVKNGAHSRVATEGATEGAREGGWWGETKGSGGP